MRHDETQDLLRGIDAYVEGLFAPPDGVPESALRRSREAGLPEIHVPPSEGKLLQLLAGLSGARCILEIRNDENEVGSGRVCVRQPRCRSLLAGARI